GGEGCAIAIWDVRLRTLTNRTFDVGLPAEALAWSPDGNLLAYTQLPGPLTIRNVQTGKLEVSTLSPPPTRPIPEGHALYTVRFTRSAQRPTVTHYLVARRDVTVTAPTPLVTTNPPSPRPTSQSPTADLTAFTADSTTVTADSTRPTADSA